MNPGPKELSIKQEVISKCWSYLRDNFHKFNETNQIKIALALATKDIPQEIIGDVTHYVEMPVIKVGARPLEFFIGNN